MRFNGRGFTDTLLLASLVSADGSSSGFIKDSEAGNLPATATNDNASAGKLGEVISSAVASGSAVSLTTGVAADATSITLTAGDWDVWGQICFIPGATTSITQYQGGINTTSATLPTAETVAAARLAFDIAAVVSGVSVQSFPLVAARLSLASSTTVYLIGRATFTISTMGAFGKIIGRRRR